MKNSQKYFFASFIIVISLLAITGVVYFGISPALAQVNTTDNVTCRLKINGLCYNTTYVKNVNNTAQTQNYNSDIATVVTSEPANQPKSYTLNSLVNRKFYLHNNSSNPINVEIRATFYPVALIEYGTFSLQKLAQDLPLQTVNLGSLETKEVQIKIPTNQQSLSASIVVSLKKADDPNAGISFAYYSQPFSIYNPTDALATCQGFTISKNFGNYLCTSDTFIPLGAMGCRSSDAPPTGKQCINNHWYPWLSRDRSAENIKMLVADVYLTDDQNIISGNEQIVSGALTGLKNKIADIKSSTGNPKTISVDQRNCGASRASVLNYLNQIDPNSASFETITDGMLLLCGLSRTNYTHTFLNFKSVSDSDSTLIANKVFKGTVSKGLYVGKGIFFSFITSVDDWPVILHEMTHSFGAPDLYTQSYVYGSTYLWGDCQLMKHDSFDQNTPLCPLEKYYWGAIGGVSVPPTTQTAQSVTPSASTINSGDSVKLTFKFPTNAVRASLYLACPTGVTDAGNVCNKFKDVTSSSDTTIIFYNNSSKTQNVVPNYYIYSSAKPNYAVGVSSQVAVKPIFTSTPPIVQPTPTTNIKLLVLLVKFQNTITEPYSKSYMQGQVFTNSNSVKKFYEKVSYGRMSVTGDVFGSYTIPDVADGTCDTNKKKWMDDAQVVAQHNGVNIGQYTHIVFVFSDQDRTNSGCKFVGEAYPLDAFPRAIVFTGGSPLIVHELGHTLGLGHADSLDCGQDIIKANYHSTCAFINYGDPFDFMGPDEEEGQRLFSFSAIHRIGLGWFLPSNIQSITTNGTYVIHALETPSTAVQVLKIKKPDIETGYPTTQNDYYFIDYNPDVDYAVGKSVDGVFVRVWNQDRGFGTLLLDMTPKSCVPSPFNPNGCPLHLHSDWDDGMLKDGMTFIDNNGIRIMQISHTSTEATVSVTLPQSTTPSTACPTGYTCIPGTPTSPQPSNCPFGYICTINQPTIPIPPTTQTKQSIIPSVPSINSGDSVRFNFSFPSNTVKASLYLACPSGVTTGANPEVCNRYMDVTSATDWSSTFTNSTSQVQNIVPNYYVYLSTNPNYAVGVSSQVSVKPTSTPIPPVTQAVHSVTPSASTINSGDSVKLTFKFPTNTVRASLYLACPSGVTDAGNVCNKLKDITSSSDTTIILYNSSPNTQNVVPNYYIYLSTNPNYAIQAFSQITVRSASVRVTSPSPVVSYSNQGMTASVWNTMWSFIKSLFSTKKDLPSPSIQTSITFLSPNEGEHVPAGSSLLIKWNSTNVSNRIRLSLHLSGIQQAIYSDSGDTSVSDNGTLTWKVPTTFDELNSTPVDRDYVAYITIQDAQNNDIIGQSKDFIITPSTVTANWKTYNNKNYGFELKYPNGYSLTEKPNGISLESSSNCKAIKTGGGSWPKECLVYDLLIQSNKISAEGVDINKTTTQVSGYSAERIEDNNQGMWDGMIQTTIQFNKDNRWYINRISFNSENKTISENILKQILETFKFTSPDTTSN